MKVLAAVVLVACGSKPAREEPRPLASSSTPTTAPMPAESFVTVVSSEAPTTARELQAWLAAGHYKLWARESKAHPSAGPHAETVVTFVSPVLEKSLAAKASAHPRGAASVKELYQANKHTGWAVSVKTADDSANGKNWYWYEVFATTPDAKAPYQGVGVELCRDCHAEGGVDQVLVSFPLQ
jgi:hypothetical protein